MLNLKFPLEEYFKYYSPTTEERKALHNKVNDESLKLFKLFSEADCINSQEIESIYDIGYELLTDICKEPTCYKWALDCLWKVRMATFTNYYERNENIFMHMQQFRMFLNQAVTIQELENN